MIYCDPSRQWQAIGRMPMTDETRNAGEAVKTLDLFSRDRVLKIARLIDIGTLYNHGSHGASE